MATKLVLDAVGELDPPPGRAATSGVGNHHDHEASTSPWLIPNGSFRDSEIGLSLNPPTCGVASVTR
jgi:hypothetical protein